MPKHTIVTPGQWQSWSSENSIVDPLITKVLNNLYQNTTIYERLDNLIALYEACKDHKPVQAFITELQQQAGKFIEVIGNSPDIEATISARKQMRDAWPTFLPNTSLRHLRPMPDKQTRRENMQHRLIDHVRALGKHKLLDVTGEDKLGDAKLGVKMLTPLEKEKYRVMPSEGLLWQLQQPEDEHSLLSVQPFETKELVAHNGRKGAGIFVMNPQGELFSGSSDMGKFHHSSFQSGGYVTYGGTWQVEDGNMQYVDDYSGHYAPKAKQFFNVMKEFKSRGIIHEDTVINKKFNEDAGIKVGSSETIMNTRGFLGLASLPRELEAPKPIDHYQVLQLFLFNTVEDQTNPAWRMFAVVMSEYLKNQIHMGNHDENLVSHYEEIQEFARELEIDPDFASHNPDALHEYRAHLTEIITTNKGLMDELRGTDWLIHDTPELTKKA